MKLLTLSNIIKEVDEVTRKPPRTSSLYTSVTAYYLEYDFFTLIVLLSKFIFSRYRPKSDNKHIHIVILLFNLLYTIVTSFLKLLFIVHDTFYLRIREGVLIQPVTLFLIL